MKYGYTLDFKKIIYFLKGLGDAVMKGLWNHTYIIQNLGRET